MKTEFIKGNDSLVVMICGEHTKRWEEVYPFSFLYVYCEDWNRDLTPWPSQHVFSHTPDFTGGADVFLEELIHKIDTQYKNICILGYSLGGLFSLYACSKTNLFTHCASISGSLWYKDFLPYIKKNPIQCKACYLSLGNQEKNAKQQPLQCVEENTKTIYEILNKQIPTVFEMNEGNHFQQEEERIQKGLEWFRI